VGQSSASDEILSQVRNLPLLFTGTEPAAERLEWLNVHALDLKETGEIKFHVDNIEASGNVIAGLSLLSDCVLQLRNEKTGAAADVFVPQFSLYVMMNEVRYEYAHAIPNVPIQLELQNKTISIHKGRRISLMFRNKATSGGKQISYVRG